VLLTGVCVNNGIAGKTFFNSPSVGVVNGISPGAYYDVDVSRHEYRNEAYAA